MRKKSKKRKKAFIWNLHRKVMTLLEMTSKMISKILSQQKRTNKAKKINMIWMLAIKVKIS